MDGSVDVKPDLVVTVEGLLPEERATAMWAIQEALKAEGAAIHGLSGSREASLTGVTVALTENVPPGLFSQRTAHPTSAWLRQDGEPDRSIPLGLDPIEVAKADMRDEIERASEFWGRPDFAQEAVEISLPNLERWALTQGAEFVRARWVEGRKAVVVFVIAPDNLYGVLEKLAKAITATSGTDVYISPMMTDQIYHLREVPPRTFWERLKAFFGRRSFERRVFTLEANQ